MTSFVALRRADRADPMPSVRELMEACGWRDLIGRNATVLSMPLASRMKRSGRLAMA